MREVVVETGESALLGILLGAEVLLIARADPAGDPYQSVPAVGVRLLGHLSAFGRALLMNEEHQVRSMFPAGKELAAPTGKGPRRQNDLLALLRQQAEQGFAADHGEVHRSTTSVAAPVVDHLGHPVASLGVTYWSASRDAAGRRALADLLLRSAATLSGRLGFRAQTAEAS
jgi:DNA-binding IclR family transcriptional regulator